MKKRKEGFVFKSYQFRIYPTKEQKKYFKKCFDGSRFIYNKMLADKIAHYEKTQHVLNNTPAQYKDEFPFLKEVDSLALCNAQMNLDKAYKNFFRRKEVGFPKFKSKKTTRLSYKTNNSSSLGAIYIRDGRIKIPKLLTTIKIKQHREIKGCIKSCTITQNRSGNYYISLLVESEIQKLPTSINKVGIDLGIKEFAICSDGSKYENPKHLSKSEKRLKKLNQELSRKKLGSKNRNKARLKVAKLHEKIANQRKDFLNKLSTKIINENQVIVLEDLGIKSMLESHRMSKFISDVSWSKFRIMMEYKAGWYGKQIVIAPSNYPSSQLCSDCGFKNVKVKDLSVREWLCPECGSLHDRDINASKNLLKLAG